MCTTPTGADVNDDLNIAFYMRVYKEDQKLAHVSLKFIRKFYKKSTIFIVSDGVYDLSLTQLANEFEAELWLTPRLYEPQFGGRIVSSQLSLWSQVSANYFVKIDPDAIMYRRFKNLPSNPGIYGSMQHGDRMGEKVTSIQGGCTLHVGRSTIGPLSEALLDNKIITNPEIWGGKRVMNRLSTIGITSDDWIREYAARVANVKIEHYSEINSVWKPPAPLNQIIDGEYQYAVTHPHKVIR